MAKIHPSAIVADGATLENGVEVGPFCYVGPNVKIGAGTRLIGHCNIDGYTTLGRENVIHPFAALGQPAQDHSVVPGEATYLNIGDGNIFREGCTIHTGTKPGSETRIGNHNMFMNATHVAHNCIVGNNVIYVGYAGTAGYCQVFDNALISGLVGIHQFCRVGRYAIISGGSVFSKDVPPFMMAEGRNGGVKMINKVGLQRADSRPRRFRSSSRFSASTTAAGSFRRMRSRRSGRNCRRFRKFRNSSIFVKPAREVSSRLRSKVTAAN